jgi:uncharacterized protein
MNRWSWEGLQKPSCAVRLGSRRAAQTLSKNLGAVLLCCWAAVAQAAPLPTQERQLNQALEAYSLDRHALAARGFSVLARQGVPMAQYNLAMMHLREELPRASFATARRLLESAAQRGVVLANLALAQVYELGAGVKPDLRRANQWLERGAQLGHDDAQMQLATNHYLGTAKSPERAAHWFREAAKNGEVGSQYMLASMYEKGEGVPLDLRLAAYWYEIAAQNGDIGARFKHREVQERLKAELPT